MKTSGGFARCATLLGGAICPHLSGVFDRFPAGDAVCSGSGSTDARAWHSSRAHGRFAGGDARAILGAAICHLLEHSGLEPQRRSVLLSSLSLHSDSLAAIRRIESAGRDHFGLLGGLDRQRPDNTNDGGHPLTRRRLPQRADVVTAIERYFPLCRLPEFIAGMALGRIMLIRGGAALRGASLLALASMGAIGLMAALGAARPQFLNASGAMSPLFVLVIWSLTNEESALAKILTKGPLVFFGEASYSIYILHLPLFAIWAIATMHLIPHSSSSGSSGNAELPFAGRVRGRDALRVRLNISIH